MIFKSLFLPDNLSTELSKTKSGWGWGAAGTEQSVSECGSQSIRGASGWVSGKARPSVQPWSRDPVSVSHLGQMNGGCPDISYLTSLQIAVFAICVCVLRAHCSV